MISQAELGSLIRHLLTTVGGVLVSKGYLDAGTNELLIGAAMSVFGVGWAIWEKRHRA